MTQDINNVEIKHCGSVKTIGNMLEELNKNRASYWHWHTLLNRTIALYRKARVSEPYGVLLPNGIIINGKTSSDIEGAIRQGGYDKERLIKLVSMYAFLTNTEGGI